MDVPVDNEVFSSALFLPKSTIGLLNVSEEEKRDGSDFKDFDGTEYTDTAKVLTFTFVNSLQNSANWDRGSSEALSESKFCLYILKFSNKKKKKTKGS